MSSPKLGIATAKWTVEMLKGISDAKSNNDVLCSPLSVAGALAMAYAGADGNTAKQLQQTLFNGLTEAQVQEGFGQLLSELGKKQNNDFRLQPASALFGQKGLTLVGEFTEKLKGIYQSEFQAVDFKSSADGATNEMNQWVETRTEGQIKNLVPAGLLSDSSQLVLVCATRFKGVWRNPFREDNTVPEVFHHSDGHEKFVEMMHQRQEFAHYESEADGVEILGLPYENCEMRMFVILPKKRGGLAKFEQTLTGAKLEHLIGKICDQVPGLIEVSLPKFRLECRHSLAGQLTSLGLSDAFGAGADFGKMTDVKGLCISAVLHKAVIEVNEVGSEAVTTKASPAPELCIRTSEPPPQFVANHPFLIVVTDRHPHMGQLFLGRYAGGS